MFRWIDIPPVWFAGFAWIAWLQSQHFSFGLSFGSVWFDFIGGLLIGGGVLLILLAVFELRRHRTTVLPHLDPTSLVQTGIYSRTRNPIYLGDGLILLGLVLVWDAVLALALVPVFIWVIEMRFILPEENRMRRAYRMDFARYETKVRRWV